MSQVVVPLFHRIQVLIREADTMTRLEMDLQAWAAGYNAGAQGKAPVEGAYDSYSFHCGYDEGIADKAHAAAREQAVLSFIEETFETDLIKVEDFELFTHGKQVIDREGKFMLVFFDLLADDVQQLFPDEVLH